MQLVFLPPVQNGNIDYILTKIFQTWGIKMYSDANNTVTVDGVIDFASMISIQGVIVEQPYFHRLSSYQLQHWQKESRKRFFGNSMTNTPTYCYLVPPDGFHFTDQQIEQIAKWCNEAPPFVALSKNPDGSSPVPVWA